MLTVLTTCLLRPDPTLDAGEHQHTDPSTDTRVRGLGGFTELPGSFQTVPGRQNRIIIMDASWLRLFPPSESADQETNTNSWRRREIYRCLTPRGSHDLFMSFFNAFLSFSLYLFQGLYINDLASFFYIYIFCRLFETCDSLCNNIYAYFNSFSNIMSLRTKSRLITYFFRIIFTRIYLSANLQSLKL